MLSTAAPSGPPPVVVDGGRPTGRSGEWVLRGPSLGGACRTHGLPVSYEGIDDADYVAALKVLQQLIRNVGGTMS